MSSLFKLLTMFVPLHLLPALRRRWESRYRSGYDPSLVREIVPRFQGGREGGRCWRRGQVFRSQRSIPCFHSQRCNPWSAVLACGLFCLAQCYPGLSLSRFLLFGDAVDHPSGCNGHSQTFRVRLGLVRPEQCPEASRPGVLATWRVPVWAGMAVTEAEACPMAPGGAAAAEMCFLAGTMTDATLRVPVTRTNLTGTRPRVRSLFAPRFRHHRRYRHPASVEPSPSAGAWRWCGL